MGLRLWVLPIVVSLVGCVAPPMASPVHRLSWQELAPVRILAQRLMIGWRAAGLSVSSRCRNLALVANLWCYTDAEQFRRETGYCPAHVKLPGCKRHVYAVIRYPRLFQSWVGYCLSERIVLHELTHLLQVCTGLRSPTAPNIHSPWLREWGVCSLVAGVDCLGS